MTKAKAEKVVPATINLIGRALVRLDRVVNELRGLGVNVEYHVRLDDDGAPKTETVAE